jgi:hypothetical protein
MCKIIREIILNYVGVSMPLDPNAKNLRLHGPDKYNGTDDIDTFINFLKGLVRYMYVYGYTGHEWDYRRIVILGSHLKGRAEFWYNKTIDISTYQGNFETAMTLLFQRFVHSATSGHAWNRYEAVQYKASEGIRALYDELMDAADHLVQKPTEIEISKRFISKLPRKIAEYLHLYRGVTAEGTSLRKILTLAIEREEAEEEWKSLQKQSAASSSGQSGNHELINDELNGPSNRHSRGGRQADQYRKDDQQPVHEK